ASRGGRRGEPRPTPAGPARAPRGRLAAPAESAAARRLDPDAAVARGRPPVSTSRRGLAALAVGVMLVTSSPARAEVVERVVATIDDDAIFLSELRRRAAPFLERVMATPSEVQRMAAIEELYRQVLDRMVEE